MVAWGRLAGLLLVARLIGEREAGMSRGRRRVARRRAGVAAARSRSRSSSQLAGEDTQSWGVALRRSRWPRSAGALIVDGPAGGRAGQRGRGAARARDPVPATRHGAGVRRRRSGVTRRRLLLAPAPSRALARRGVLAPLGSLGSDDAGSATARGGRRGAGGRGRRPICEPRRSRSDRSRRPSPAAPIPASWARRAGRAAAAPGCPRAAELGAGRPLAFSKICTHAGCAVAMLRSPLYPDHSPPPGAGLPVPLLDVRPGATRAG